MGTIARYTEPPPMSIRVTPLPSSSLALMREARVVFARALGLAVAATLLLVLGGAVRTLPGMAGLMLFVGLLVALERLLAGNHPYPRLGAANRITLVRAGVACLIASRAMDPAPLGTAERWVLVALAGAALLLDGTDGWAARRQGLASAFGARFDMEIDAFAIAVLAITAVKAAAVPCWVLAIGAMRYLYLVRGLYSRSCAARRRHVRSPIAAARRSRSCRAWRCSLRSPRRHLRVGPRRFARWRWACSPIPLPPTSSCCCLPNRIDERRIRRWRHSHHLL